MPKIFEEIICGRRYWNYYKNKKVMKWINIILVCVAICCGEMTSCLAQQNTEKDALLERIARMYNIIPRDLATDEWLKKVDEADRIVSELCDSLSNQEIRCKAQLIRFNGLLWSMQQADEAMKKELEKRIHGLDLDSPELELLSDIEIVNLLNGYFRIFMPEASEVARATYVLYNIKSEKVRNSYVPFVLVSALKKSGYTDEVEDLMEDIELCSKTEATLREARKLKEAYYPLRAGAVAPDFEMENEYGELVKLSDFKGKVVFIDVWATWCGGCVKGLPAFVALREQYKNRDDVVFLTISYDEIEAKSRWLEFLKEKKYSGKVPHLISNKEKDLFEKDYCITGIPRYILIDRKGKIVNAWHVAANHELFPWIFSTELD